MSERKPAELTPAYDRPTDIDSIDARMGAQLSWEALATPRRRHEHRRRGSAARRVAVGVGIAAAAFGAVELVGRAVDQNIAEHSDRYTQVSDSGFANSGVDKNGKFQFVDGKLKVKH